jgi:hypothetical protein
MRNNDVRLSDVRLHALLIKKLVSKYEHREITDNEFLAAIKDRTNLIIDVTKLEN